ncbi:MAG: 50S ribosomal protein L3 N(5)-glutamine methyltransferase [Pseudomonadota bacterium]
MLLQDVTNTQECLQRITAAFEQAELFFGHGTDNAWDEACWLLETLARRNGMPLLELDTQLPPALVSEVERIATLRLETRKPLAYLLQEAWFCELAFYVDERVLVPRSPFAELIRNRFETLLAKPPRRILDLCAGGGCIGIACAVAFPDAEVVLADLSPDALAVARINIEKHKLSTRVQLVESDLFGKLTGKFDLIVSNPPYVGAEEYAELPDEYLREPQLGLLTGEDGLEIPLRILQQAADFLTEDGLLLLETGATWPLLDEARPDLPFLWLEFEYGGEGICALKASELRAQSR